MTTIYNWYLVKAVPDSPGDRALSDSIDRLDRFSDAADLQGIEQFQKVTSARLNRALAKLIINLERKR
jgi:hypothetical protein